MCGSSRCSPGRTEATLTGSSSRGGAGWRRSALPLLVQGRRALGFAPELAPPSSLALNELGLALKEEGLPCGLALKEEGLPFGLVLKVFGLPLVPGSDARNGVGPALLVYPSKRRQHDGADGHPLVEAAAAQHMTNQSQPDQPQRQPSPRT